MAKARRARYITHVGTGTFVRVLPENERRTALIVSCHTGSGAIKLGESSAAVSDGIAISNSLPPVILTRDLLGDEIASTVYIRVTLNNTAVITEITES